MKRVRFVFQPILFVLLFISAVTVQAGAYPDFPIALKDGSGALVGETVYAGLGSAGSQFYALNLKQPKAEWQQVTDFPGGERKQAIAVTLHDELYLFGGLQADQNGTLQLMNDVYRYQPSKKQWSKLATQMPQALIGASAIAYDDKIYLLGGEQQTSFNGELLSYDPVDNQWRNEGELPFAARVGAAVINQGEFLLVAGGAVSPNSHTAQTEQGCFTQQKADKKTIEWKVLADLPASQGKTQQGVSGAAAGYSNGYYLVAGGSSFVDQQISNKIWHKEIYILKNKRWKAIGELSYASSYAVAVSYQDKLVMIGGETESGAALSAVQTLYYDGSKLIIE
jgi:N-acetylneuraminate epimerase